MGLDMYLFSVPKIEGMDLDEILMADIHLSDLEAEKNEIYEKVKGHIKDFEDPEIELSWRGLITQIAYWRKANQVHNWFVEHVQNGVDECGTFEVSKENLEELYNKCNKILSRKADPIEVLPTKPGFYFGSTDYDDFYYFEIDRTKSTLAEILKNLNFDTHYLVYNSSW